MKNILVFDIELTGHHSEYINYLVDYVLQTTFENKHFYFVLHPMFEIQFPTIFEKANKCKKIEIILLSYNHYQILRKGSLSYRSIKYYNILNQIAAYNKIDEVILLDFNIFQFSFSIFRPSYDVKGILFHPFFRTQNIDSLINFQYLRKFLLTLTYAANPKIKTIYILNDVECVDYLNKTYNSNSFKHLPDPIPNNKIQSDINIRKKFCLESRKVYLHFGALSVRKGTLTILDSIQYIDSNLQKQVAILIFGKAPREVDDAIKNRISFIERNHPNIVIIYRNQFATPETMGALFAQSDYSLIPYQRPEASSGILGHSVLYNLPIIGPEQGLVGELIKKYRLGITLPSSTPKRVGEAIVSTLNYTHSPIDTANYLAQNSPLSFAKTIIADENIEI